MFVVDIIGDGEFDGDVRGESNYQVALEKIAGPRSDLAKRFSCHAVLIREPTNPFDPNAVRVEIQGMTVGYLPRDDAEEIGEFLLDEGGVAAVGRCNAIIVGGWTRSSGDGSFGVKLDIDWPPERRTAAEVRPFVAAQPVAARQAPRDLSVWSKTITAAATAALALSAVFLWKNSRPPVPQPLIITPTGMAQQPAPPPLVASEPVAESPAQAAPIAPAGTRTTPKPANVPLPPPRPRELK